MKGIKKMNCKKVLLFGSAAAVVLCIVCCICIHFTQRHSIKTPDYRRTKVTVPYSEGMEFFLYHGNCYVFGGFVDQETVQPMLQRQLGVTASNELDLQKESLLTVDFNRLPDFTCMRPGIKLYSVNGYDEDFCLIGISEENDGTTQARIYESPYGLTVKNGKDFFDSKLHMGEVFSAYYSTNRIEGEKEALSGSELETVNAFIKSLETAKPYEFLDSFRGVPSDRYYTLVIANKANEIQKTLYLWKDGDNCFVAYGNTYKIIFTAEQQSFQALWKVFLSHNPLYCSAE